jgi:hypothetical protein
MYLYIVAFGIKKREIEQMNAKNYEIDDLTTSYGMAAEPGNND